LRKFGAKFHHDQLRHSGHSANEQYFRIAKFPSVL